MHYRLYGILIYSLFLIKHGSACNTTPPIKIGLDWIINIHHGVLIYARAKGYIPKNTEFIPFQSSTRALQHLAHGYLDYALSYAPNVEKMNQKGLNVQSGYILINHPLEVFVSHYPMQQLKGKTIAHQASPGSITEKYLNHILNKVDLSLHDVQITFSLYHVTIGLMSHHFDAAMNIPRIHVKEILKNCPHLYIYNLEDFGISFAGQILVHKKSHQNYRPFYKAIAQAKKDIMNNPETSWQVIIKEYPELNNANGKESWLCYCYLLNE